MLINYYRTIEISKSVVTRKQWAAGLKKVLGLNIPFLEFQEYLGLPKLGVHGKMNGDVDYMAFLLRFTPRSTLLKNKMPKDVAEAKALETLEKLSEIFFNRRFELESLFRHFDANGDEKISVEEFKDGILAIQRMVGKSFSEDEVDSLISLIDSDRDGFVSYSEFCHGFELSDPELNERIRRSSADNTLLR